MKEKDEFTDLRTSLNECIRVIQVKAMLFVLPGILFIGLIIIGIWAIFFRSTVQQEIQRERKSKEKHQRAEEIERWLSTPEEPLYCASCDAVFHGPLAERGCPRCHSHTLVIPVRASSDAHVHERARSLPAVSDIEDTTATERGRRPPTAVSEETSSVREPLSQRKTGI